MCRVHFSWRSRRLRCYRGAARPPRALWTLRHRPRPPRKQCVCCVQPQPAGGVYEAEKQVSSSALRVGLVALRRVQAGEELVAPYIALGQPMQARQRELSSRFFDGRPASGGFAAASATGAGAAVSAAAFAAEVADTASTGSCSLPGLSSLQRQPPQLVCNCPRCLLEAGGDHRLCGREMLKVCTTLVHNLRSRYGHDGHEAVLGSRCAGPSKLSEPLSYKLVQIKIGCFRESQARSWNVWL